MLNKKILLCASVFFLIFSFSSQAKNQLNYQGRITDKQGVPLSGAYTLSLSIVSPANGNQVLWGPEEHTTTLSQGIFDVYLGSIKPLPTNLFEDNESLYIKTEISSAGKPFETFVPFTEIAFVGKSFYSLKAKSAKLADSATIALTANSVADKAITASKFSSDIPTTNGKILSYDFSSASLKWIDPPQFGGGSSIWKQKANDIYFFNTSLADTGNLGIRTAAPRAKVDIYQRSWGDSGGLAVIGTEGNLASKDFAIAIGYDAKAEEVISTVVGGSYNRAKGHTSCALGGSANIAEASTATIVGGLRNNAKGYGSTIVGGSDNQANATGAVMIGGNLNESHSTYAAVIGGGNNKVGVLNDPSSSYASIILGGADNSIFSKYSSITGGQNNSINKNYSGILGGTSNTVQAELSSILGGNGNIVSAQGSLAFGFGVNVTTPKTAAFYSSTNPGNFCINTTMVKGPLTVGESAANNGNGAHLTSGGTWTSASSRTFKDRFIKLDNKMVLEKIKNLAISGYYYKGTNEYHVGPTAEDFHWTFGTGEKNKETASKYLATSDVAGISLAAIQELAKENDELKTKLSRLEKIIEKLDRQVKQQDHRNAGLQNF